MELFQMSFTIQPKDFMPILDRASKIESDLKTGVWQIGNLIRAVKTIKKDQEINIEDYGILNSLVQNLKNVAPDDDNKAVYIKFINAIKQWKGFKDADTSFRTTLLVAEKRLGLSKTPENLIRAKEFFRSIGKAIFGSSEKTRLAKAVQLAKTESKLIKSKQKIVDLEKTIEKQATEQKDSKAKAKEEIQAKEEALALERKQALRQQSELQQKEHNITILRERLEQASSLKQTLEQAVEEHKGTISQKTSAIGEWEVKYRVLNQRIQQQQQQVVDAANKWGANLNEQVQEVVRQKDQAIANAEVKVKQMEALLSKAPPVLKEEHTPDQYKSLAQYWSLPATLKTEVPELMKYVDEEVDLTLFNRSNLASITDDEIRKAQIFGKGSFNEFSIALTKHITLKTNYEELAHSIPMYVYDALRNKIEPLTPEKANLLKRVCDQLYQTLMQNFETRHYEEDEEHRASVAGAGYWTDQALLTAITTHDLEKGWEVFKDNLPLSRDDWRYNLKLIAGLTRAHMLSTRSTNPIAGKFYQLFLSKVKEEGLG